MNSHRGNIWTQPDHCEFIDQLAIIALEFEKYGDPFGHNIISIIKNSWILNNIIDMIIRTD